MSKLNLDADDIIQYILQNTPLLPEQINSIKAQGAAAERARIRVAVESIGLFTVYNEWYRGFMECRNAVLSLLKDGDGE